MITAITDYDVLMLTYALPNCAVAIASLPDDAGLWVRLHNGATLTIPRADLPPRDLPTVDQRRATEQAIYAACLARQKRPAA